MLALVHELKPTVVFVAYGRNESYRGEAMPAPENATARPAPHRTPLMEASPADANG